MSRLRALAAHVLRVSILSKAFPDLHAGLREEIAQLVAHAEDAVAKEETKDERPSGIESPHAIARLKVCPMSTQSAEINKIAEALAKDQSDLREEIVQIFAHVYDDAKNAKYDD